MATDVDKHLDRAKKYLERNKLEDAVESYAAALEAQPSNLEVMQALGDLYARMSKPDRAAVYYGMLFDRFVDAGDGTKATVLFSRFLKATHQPAERLVRYAVLLQKQNKSEEAMEAYAAAAELHVAAGQQAAALTCLEKAAQLDPDNPARHVVLGEFAERMGRSDLAARGYLRAGQLAQAAGQVDDALKFLAGAQRLAPGDRSVALFYASARLRKGDAPAAVQLLESFAGEETDTFFLETFGEALLRAGKLEVAGMVLWQLFSQCPESSPRLFDLAHHHLQAGDGTRALEILRQLEEKMFAARAQSDFALHVDRLVEANPASLPLIEFWARLYNELNREAKYFDALARLFDLYLQRDNVAGACDALERLVDIDAYDHSNQARLEHLETRASPEQLRRLSSRLARTSSGTSHSSVASAGSDAASAAPVSEEARARQALDDLVVQAEIFLQYSLRPKAIERLQKIAELFPGAEEQHLRLRNLFDAAGWWPPGAERSESPPPADQLAASPPAPVARTGTYSAETLRDLAKISEISRNVFRQGSPRAVLAAAAQEVGNYLRVTRCLVTIGAGGQTPQMAAEFHAPELKPLEAAQIDKLLRACASATPNSLGTIELRADETSVVRTFGFVNVLAVPLMEKEKQGAAGMILIASSEPREWKPTESYFLQAVGDQLLISYNHTRLRSLVRNLAVADEKTGLLSRSSYTDCLLAEMNRARTQKTALSLVILQMDRPSEVIQQHGEAVVERHMEQLAQQLLSGVRQNDLSVKYTAWALAFVLPDTGLAGALNFADKMRKAGAGFATPWERPTTLSGAVVESVNRYDYESEDLVTDLMNRAESSLEEAARKGGDTLVSL